MKKFFVAIVAAVIAFGATSTTASAQKKLAGNFMNVGIHTGALGEGALGLGVNFDFNAGNWRGRLLIDGANLFNDAPAVIAPAVDFHYLVPVVGGLDVYPIVGVNGWISTSKHAPFNLGADLGAGIEYRFTDTFSLFAEYRWQYMILESGKFSTSIFGCTFAL